MLQTTALPVHPAWHTSKPGAMPTFQRMPWRPVVLPHNPNLGQGGEGTAKAVVLSALLLPTAAAAAVSFVGFRLGSQDDSWAGVLGYVVGVLGGLSALLGILAMFGVAVTPFNFGPKKYDVALPGAPAPAAVTTSQI